MTIRLCLFLACVFSPSLLIADQPGQLPDKMHTPMSELPSVTVGLEEAAIAGNDNRALQAAVDYIGNLGGGTVHVGAGEYLMHDSLHLRSNVRVVGVSGSTILKKAKSSHSPLLIDGDFGEEQITLKDPTGFEIGYGVAVSDQNAGGFHTVVARITGKRGNTFSIDKPLNADCMIRNGAYAATTFPVISGYEVKGVELQNLTIEGNKDSNDYLNGCRGGGIFLYRGFGTVIDGCHIRNYHGDGISFQQSNDVTVKNCISEGNTHLGFHPGSGSQRPTLMANIARHNGQDGIFLCWRVKFGTFENNLLENNGRHGLSIGHKDTDNLIRSNKITSNAKAGIYFRLETVGMAGHRNTIEQNVIENNTTSGIHVSGATNDVVIRDNVLNQPSTSGVVIESEVGQLTLKGNQIDATKEIEDKRSDEGEREDR